MKLDINIEKKFNLKNIKLDLHKELNFAGDVVKEDHFKRLERGLGVSGPMKNLADSTIIAKGFDQILVNEGSMRNLKKKKATRTKQFVELSPHDKRKRNGVTDAQIGLYHQEGGGRLPKREWFGITVKSEKRALKIIELKIDKLLRDA